MQAGCIVLELWNSRSSCRSVWPRSPCALDQCVLRFPKRLKIYFCVDVHDNIITLPVCHAEFVRSPIFRNNCAWVTIACRCDRAPCVRQDCTRVYGNGCYSQDFSQIQYTRKPSCRACTCTSPFLHPAQDSGRSMYDDLALMRRAYEVLVDSRPRAGHLPVRKYVTAFL